MNIHPNWIYRGYEVDINAHWIEYGGIESKRWAMLSERQKWLFTIILKEQPLLICNGPSGEIDRLSHTISKEDAMFLLGLSRDEAVEQVEKVYGPLNVG